MNEWMNENEFLPRAQKPQLVPSLTYHAKQ